MYAEKVRTMLQYSTITYVPSVKIYKKVRPQFYSFKVLEVGALFLLLVYQTEGVGAAVCKGCGGGLAYDYLVKLLVFLNFLKDMVSQFR